MEGRSKLAGEGSMPFKSMSIGFGLGSTASMAISTAAACRFRIRESLFIVCRFLSTHGLRRSSNARVGNGSGLIDRRRLNDWGG